MLAARILASFTLAGGGAPGARSNADAPRGALTLVGPAVDAWATLTHRDRPVGTITLAGGATVSQPIVRPGVVQIPGLPRTAMPGTPGLVQPGYFCTGVATWHGPFAAEVTLGLTSRVLLSAGQQLTVAPNVASQLAAGNATWFEFH